MVEGYAPVTENPAPLFGAPMFKDYGLGINAGYAYILTYFNTSFTAPSFTGSWNGGKALGGWGWDLYLDFGDFTPGEMAFRISIGSFTGDVAANSFTSGGNYVRESSSTSLTYIKGNVIFFTPGSLYFYGGVGGYFYSIKTSVDTNYALYKYTGFEGKTSAGGAQAGISIRFGIFENVKFNLNVEGDIFFIDENTVVGKSGLEFGILPTGGISCAW
jgi:hypothetical protein